MATAKQRAAARRNIKKAQAARKRKKGGRRRKSVGKRARRYVRRKAKKVYRSATSRPFTFIDNVLSLANFAGPMVHAYEAQKRDGSGAQFLVSAFTGMSFDDRWNYQGFDSKRLATGYAPLATSVIYKKEMGMLNKMAPVKGIIPKTIGDARNIITNVIGRIGAFNAVKKAMEAGSGRKMTNFTRQFTESYTGIDLNDDLYYHGWDAYRLYKGQGPFVGSLIFQKGTSMLTKNLRGKFNMPRL